MISSKLKVGDKIRLSWENFDRTITEIYEYEDHDFWMFRDDDEGIMPKGKKTTKTKRSSYGDRIRSRIKTTKGRKK